MNLRLSILLACTLILPLAAVQARAPADPRAEITRQVRAVLLRDDMSEHDPAVIAAQVTPIDINGDGIQDWQVDWNMLGMQWCGTGGCRYQLWLGRKAGPPLKVFDRRVRDRKVETRDGRILFVFDFHGTHCGGYGAQECPGTFTWNAKRGRMVLVPMPGKSTRNSQAIERF